MSVTTSLTVTVVLAVLPLRAAVIFATPPTAPDAVKRPVVRPTVPISPRSMVNDAGTSTPPVVTALNCSAGAGVPDVKVRT